MARKPLRKPSRKSLTAKADREWSRLIRLKGYCELAHKDHVACSGFLQGAHIIGRRYRSTRWDLENGLALCQGHHTYYTHRPEGFYLLIESLRPGLWSELYRRAQESWDGDLDAVLAGLVARGEAIRRDVSEPATKTGKAGSTTGGGR